MTKSTNQTYEIIKFFNYKNVNDLQSFTDDELVSLYQLFEKNRSSSNNEIYCKLCEIEISYVQREQEIRMNRVIANNRYLESYFSQNSNEDDYPDFDQNSNNEYVWLDSLRQDLQSNNKMNQSVN